MDHPLPAAVRHNLRVATGCWSLALVADLVLLGCGGRTRSEEIALPIVGHVVTVEVAVIVAAAVLFVAGAAYAVCVAQANALPADAWDVRESGSANLFDTLDAELRRVSPLTTGGPLSRLVASALPLLGFWLAVPGAGVIPGTLLCGGFLIGGWRMRNRSSWALRSCDFWWLPGSPGRRDDSSPA